MSTLKEKDIYGILLYAIYKCTNDERYATISELIYALDKDSLLNLCAVFGGCTILVPTLQLLKTYTNALIVYDSVSHGSTYTEAVLSLKLNKQETKELLSIYNTICEVIKEYELTHT